MTDSKEHILYNKEEAEKGKFAFTTDDQDMFEICFVSNKEGNGFSRGEFIISLKSRPVTIKHLYDYIVQMQKPTKLKLMSRKVSKLRTTMNR